MRTRNYELLFRKADAQTRVSLPGAVFRLIGNGGTTYTATSDEYGMVDFYPILPGLYTLVEETAPDGYLLPEERYPVSVGPCGRCCVNGLVQNDLVLLNEKMCVNR